MADMENRTTEQEMALFVMMLLGKTEDGCLSLDQLRAQIEPSGLLTEEDKVLSQSRPAEPKWHQILRNINCNKETGNNFIHAGRLEHMHGGGYCLTEEGQQFIQRLRL